MTTTSHTRRVLLQTLPISLGLFGNVALQAIDMMMLGPLGESILAAAGVCSNILNIVILFSLGIAHAMSPMISHSLATDPGHARHIYYQSLKGGFVISCFVCIVYGMIIWFLPSLVHPNLLEPARLYLIMAAPGIIPSALTQIARSALDACNKSQLSTNILYGGIVCNIVLNWLFIYGFGPIPAMGISGAALATTIARIFMMLASLYYAHKHLPLSRAVTSWKPLIKNSSVVTLQIICEAGAFHLCSIIAGKLGEIDAAAHQIALNLATLTFTMPLGYSHAQSIFFASIREKYTHLELLNTAWKFLRIALVFGLCTACLFTFLGSYLASWYTQSEVVINLCGQLLLWTALMQLGDAIQATTTGILRGLNDMNIPTAINVFSWWIVALPLGTYLCFQGGWKTHGLWMALVCGVFINAVCMISRLRYLLKKPLSMSPV
ncbi:MAG: MATE family efflux transporter [Oligoflexales bacterium]